MFQKILVPVDLSERNRPAVAAGRRLVPDGGELTLLHVIETIQDVTFEELESFYQRLEKRANVQMESLAVEESLDPEATYHRVTYGRPAREIVRFAEEEAVDLIVLGSHPLDPEHPAESWSSVSYQVAILARCAVLLVK